MNGRLWLLFAAFLAIVLGTAYGVHDGVAEDARALSNSASHVRAAAASRDKVMPAQRTNDVASSNPAPPIDAELAARVEHKYRFLLSDLQTDAIARGKLMQYLLERESTMQAAQRAAIDSGVHALLAPSDYSTYVALKDSDTQQRQLSEYMGGISKVAPLDEWHERAILEAKLRQKQHYETLLRDYGLDRETLSLAEREYAHAAIGEALQQYRDSFLTDVEPLLTAEQYTLLSSYETTEFAHELERLQQAINAK
jgi:hypothetical protein